MHKSFCVYILVGTLKKAWIDDEATWWDGFLLTSDSMLSFSQMYYTLALVHKVYFDNKREWCFGNAQPAALGMSYKKASVATSTYNV